MNEERSNNFGKSGGSSQLFQDLTGIGVDWRAALLVPALAILTALIIGAFIILVTDIDALRLWGSDPGAAWSKTWESIAVGYKALFVGSFGSLRALSETLLGAAPLILAGLSVGIGFRAGLFNIGTEGQMLIGGMAAIWVGVAFQLPIFLHLPLALIGGAIGGGIWGAVPGLLRARTGAHEVITTIMLNLIAIKLVLWLLKSGLFQAEGRDDPISETVAVSARFPRLFGFLDDSQVRVTAGIIFAVLVAWFVYWLLFKTTLGFEFRAVGMNPDGAHYAGMNVVFLYTAVMAVAGALGGLAGSDQILSILHRGSPGFSAGIGFDAIALALLGRSHPAGIVAAGVLFGALRSGGQVMQVETDLSIDLILVIQALIVVFIAAPALIKAIYRVRTGRAAEQLTTGWGT
ncbi:MAG: ABC transporter permease [Acidimicrobiia bacterium]